MKTSLAVLCAMVALGMGACERHEPLHEVAADNGGALQEDHASHAEHAQDAAPRLPQGQKWPSDEPLRTAMSRIRGGVEPLVASYEQGQLSRSDAQSLATLVEENVAYMVANCKLEPQADAVLHIIIGRMLNAAASLKQAPTSSSGTPQLVEALDEYAAAFDHAGWTALSSH
jgi:hypothetical protein